MTKSLKNCQIFTKLVENAWDDIPQNRAIQQTEMSTFTLEGTEGESSKRWCHIQKVALSPNGKVCSWGSWTVKQMLETECALRSPGWGTQRGRQSLLSPRAAKSGVQWLWAPTYQEEMAKLPSTSNSTTMSESVTSSVDTQAPPPPRHATGLRRQWLGRDSTNSGLS